MQNFSVRRALNTLVVSIDFWVCKKQYWYASLEKIFPFCCGAIQSSCVLSYLNLSTVTITFQTPVKLKRSQIRILILVLAMSLKTGPTTLCYFLFQKKPLAKTKKEKMIMVGFRQKNLTLEKVNLKPSIFVGFLGHWKWANFEILSSIARVCINAKLCAVKDFKITNFFKHQNMPYTIFEWEES